MTGPRTTPTGSLFASDHVAVIREALERIIPPNDPDCGCGPCTDARTGLAELDLLVAEYNATHKALKDAVASRSEILRVTSVQFGAMRAALKWLRVGDVPSVRERKRCMANALAEIQKVTG